MASVEGVLRNVLQAMSEGSVLVLLDLKYSETRRTLEAFRDMLEREMVGVVVKETITEPGRIDSNIIRCAEMDELERRVNGGRLRAKPTNYHSMIAVRV